MHQPVPPGGSIAAALHHHDPPVKAKAHMASLRRGASPPPKKQVGVAWRPGGYALGKHGVDGVQVDKQNAWEMKEIARREPWVLAPPLPAPP